MKQTKLMTQHTDNIMNNRIPLALLQNVCRCSARTSSLITSSHDPTAATEEQPQPTNETMNKMFPLVMMNLELYDISFIVSFSHDNNHSVEC